MNGVYRLKPELLNNDEVSCAAAVNYNILESWRGFGEAALGKLLAQGFYTREFHFNWLVTSD